MTRQEWSNVVQTIALMFAGTACTIAIACWTHDRPEVWHALTAAAVGAGGFAVERYRQHRKKNGK